MSTDPRLAAFDELVDEARLLFHRLRYAAEQLHGGDPLTAGRRGVLQSLDRNGPSTVPQMARERPVSRQHVQMLVNALLEEGFVELVDNPAHKRSKLVRLTNEGRDVLDAMKQRERRAVGALHIDLSADRIRDASEVLRRVRELLAGDRWAELLERER